MLHIFVSSGFSWLNPHNIFKPFSYFPSFGGVCVCILINSVLSFALFCYGLLLHFQSINSTGFRCHELPWVKNLTLLLLLSLHLSQRTFPSLIINLIINLPKYTTSHSNVHYHSLEVADGANE